MPISTELKKQSLKNVLSRYSLTPDEQVLVAKVNGLAADADIKLDAQSQGFNSLLFTLVRETKVESTNTDNLASEIFAKLNQLLEQETFINKQRHQQQGRFDSTGLYRRSLRDQMQDHDMVSMMPKSTGNIEVLGPVSQFDNLSTKIMQDSIQDALKNPKINHVVIPIGPDHWRGVYLTKPTGAEEKYQLELFDPYGGVRARAISHFVTDILTQAGIKNGQIEIKLTGPKIPQTDMYACGDFTCAYSHKKMQEFGAQPAHYNAALINVLDTEGNKHEALRKAIRNATQSLATAAVVRKDDTLPPKQKFTEVKQDVSYKENKSTPGVVTVRASSDGYKLEIAALLKLKNSIFNQDEKATEKRKQGKALSDEEIAAQMQAEAFRDAGHKP